MLSLPVRQILVNAAFAVPANRQGLGSRVEGGLGFLPYESGDEEYYGQYDPYYDSYDRNDFSYGYGGETPGISPYEDWGGGYYFDPSTGVLYDPYGGAADTWGTGIFDFGDEILTTINTTEPDLYTNYGDVIATLNWWDTVASGGADISDDDLDAIINDSGLHSLGGEYSNVQVPATTAPKSDKLAFLKKLAEAAKKVLANSKAAPGGAAASSRPQTAQPNAAGQCPTGYTKNAAGQCVLASQKPSFSDPLLALAANPLWLLGGAVLLVLLAKK